MKNFGRYPRREIAMSYPVASHRKDTHNGDRMECPHPPLFPPPCRFAHDAQTDNLPSLDDGIILKMRGAFDGKILDIFGTGRLAGHAAVRPARRRREAHRAGGRQLRLQNITPLDNPRKDASADGGDAWRSRLHAGRRPRPARSRQGGDGSRGAEFRPAGAGRRRRAVLLCRPRRAGLRRQLSRAGQRQSRRARPMSTSRWSMSISCCARCRARARGSTW